MLQSTIILSLLEKLQAESDPDKRADLVRAAERQYYLDMEHQANFVQNRIGSLELDIREQVATSLGATNEMISQSAEETRSLRAWLQENLSANTAAVEGLRTETQAGFQSVHQGMAALGERVSNNEATLADHAAAIADFRKSRQRSMERHDTTQAQLTELTARLDAFMARIDALIAANPVSEEERADMLAFLRRSMAREAGDGG